MVTYTSVYSLASPIGRGGNPGLVRVIELHFLDNIEGIAAQVLLIDDSIVIHQERLYAGDAILGRYGYKGKSADHRSLNYVVDLA